MSTENVPEPVNGLPAHHGAHRERLYELFDQGDV
jgi:hypothetical protein